MNYELFLNLCKNRRSCRSFNNLPISEEDMRKILEAGRWVPSSHNSQNSYIIWIKNEEIKSYIRNETMKMMNVKFDPFYGAKEIILVLNSNVPSEMAFLDGSMTVYNMMLAAESLGLGSCWINTAQYQKKTITMIRDILNIETPCWGVGFLALGQRKISSEHPLPRKEGRVFEL